MIAVLVPSAVAAAEAFDDPPQARLLPDEEPVVARAVDKRRREFTTARWCARRALAALGGPAVAIPPGPRGEPRWPDGFVGSITHCAGYRAAAVARASALRSIGIDAEPDAPLPGGVLEAIAVPEERRWLERDAPAGVHWDRLLFSAKESVYKAWHPLTGRWLGFEDATVRFRPDGTFHATLSVPAPELPDGGDGLGGRWAAGSGLVVTAVVVG